MSTRKTMISANNYYYRRGGAETVFLEQNQYLEKKGWEVVPFSMLHQGNNECKWSDYFIEEIEFGNEYSSLQKLKNAVKIIYSTEANVKLNLLIQVVQPDIFHAHNIYHHISPSILKVVKQHGIPSFVTLHDLKLACPAYKMLNANGVCEKCKNGNILNVITNKCIKNSLSLSALIFMETLVHRMLGLYKDNVDKFIVPSQFYIDKFIEWGWPVEKFAYVPNFVDVESYQPEYKAGNYFLFFGRLGHEKGVDTLINAAHNAKIKLVIAGTGPESDYLQQLANSLNADVEFLGYVSGEPLKKVVQESRAIVIPSEWYENAPMSVLEAYSLAKPVVGANIGGIPELIDVGKTGFIFESGNIGQLTEVLNRVDHMSDEQLLELGRNARELACERYAIEHYMERILKLYKDAS